MTAHGSGTRDRLREEILALAKSYGPKALLIEATALLRAARAWTPECGKEYSYTYEHIVAVEVCPIPEEQEADLEADAQEKAEAKVARYCRRRQDGCTGIQILESAPSGGGCNTLSAGVLGEKHIYICRWTVKYKCVQEAQ
jgi:hypothetical protein